MALSKSLRSKVAWNLTGALLPLAFGAVVVPVLLRNLGNDGFAVLVLVWALVGYLSLFELGLGKAITVILSQPTPAANGSQSPVLAKSNLEASQLVSVALALAALAGLFGALLTAALAPSMATQWLRIESARQPDATYAFLWAAVGVLPTVLLSVQRGVLEGRGDFARSNVLRIALGVASFGLPLLAFVLHGPLVWVMAAYLVGFRVALVLAVSAWVPWWVGGLPVQWRLHSARLLQFGGWLTLSSVVGPIMVYGDRFFVSAAVGAALLPLYAIPQEALQRLLALPVAVVGAMLPGLAGALPAARLEMYARYKRRFFVWNTAICAVAALCIHPVLSLWLGSEFAQKTVFVALWLCLGLWFNALAQLPFTLLHAAGNTRITALSHLFQLPCYLGLLFAMASAWGLAGAAAAWALRAACDWLILHWAWKRHSHAGKMGSLTTNPRTANVP